MSEHETHRMGRRAGLLIGAALLLALGAWLIASLVDGARPTAASPSPRSAESVAAPREPGPMSSPTSSPAAARSTAAVPLSGAESAPDVPGAEPHVVRAGPGERALYEAYLVRFADDPDSLTREAQRALSSAGPRHRRVALLRAAWDLGLPAAPGLFDQALRSLPDDSDRQGTSVADFAVRFLGERGAREPLAWTTLFDSVHLGATRMDPRLRCVAAVRLVESASPTELPRLVALAQEEPDSRVTRSLIGALRSRPDEAARAALRELGVDVLALEPKREDVD